ncbi:MAG: type IV toxin-antitoxin system AbiEi family antitoxin domain-containing protein [Solirubrobacteraceae bacterium]
MSDARPDLRGLETQAYQQGGYFTAPQARAHGASRQLIEHHVRRGRFERVRRGLYRVHGFPRDEHDDMREAWMAVGARDALLSHQSALALLGLSDEIPDAVHLLVPRRRRGLRPPSGVLLHTHPDQEAVPTVWLDGLPLSTAARTLADVAKAMQPEQLQLAVRQALREGLATASQLEDQAALQNAGRLLEAIEIEKTRA